MAYCSSYNVQQIGNGVFKLFIYETDCANTSQFTFPVNYVPAWGRVLSVRSLLVSGDATKINPKLGEDSNIEGISKVLEYQSTDPDATEINFAPGDGGAPYAAEDGVLYHQSTPDSGTNNVIHTCYIIKGQI